MIKQRNRAFLIRHLLAVAVVVVVDQEGLLVEQDLQPEHQAPVGPRACSLVWGRVCQEELLVAVA